MYCKYCGNEIDTDSLYCMNCGKTLHKISDDENNDPIMDESNDCEEQDNMEEQIKQDDLEKEISIFIFEKRYFCLFTMIISTLAMLFLFLTPWLTYKGTWVDDYDTGVFWLIENMWDYSIYKAVIILVFLLVLVILTLVVIYCYHIYRGEINKTFFYTTIWTPLLPPVITFLAVNSVTSDFCNRRKFSIYGSPSLNIRALFLLVIYIGALVIICKSISKQKNIYNEDLDA